MRKLLGTIFFDEDGEFLFDFPLVGKLFSVIVLFALVLGGKCMVASPRVFIAWSCCCVGRGVTHCGVTHCLLLMLACVISCLWFFDKLTGGCRKQLSGF